MVLYDASMEYLLVARDPGARAPLCWGTAAETGALHLARTPPHLGRSGSRGLRALGFVSGI